MSAGTEVRLVEFGPYRVIGMSYVGANEHEEIGALWGSESGFMGRVAEVQGDPAIEGTFGICRCSPGAPPGVFEYIAGVAAAAEAPVPQGMVEVGLPAETYAVFSVPQIQAIRGGWQTAGVWLEAHPEWEGYCAPGDDCECIQHPSFEYYPPQWNPQAELFIYMPVRPAGGR